MWQCSVEFSTKVHLRVIQLNVIFRHLTSQKLPGIWTCMKMSKNVFYLLLQGWDTILSSCQDYYRVFLASAPVNCKLIDKWSSNPQKSLYLSRIWGKQFILNPQHTEQKKTFPLTLPTGRSHCWCQLFFWCSFQIITWPSVHLNITLLSESYCYFGLRVVVRKKRGYVGKIPKWRAPPLPPLVWETPVIKKKVGFIFHFRTSGTFLVFTKKSNFEWIK